MADALSDKDRRSALQGIRAAIDVTGEARNYMELSGELGRDRTAAAMSIQVVCPAGMGEMPRISYASEDAVEASESLIGVLQRR